MLPSSHPVPIERAKDIEVPSAQHLANAFSEFISASTHLEDSYRALQGEVARLNSELASRNRALTTSLAENDRIRATLQAILSSMPCGVLVADAAQRIVMINPECRNLLQVSNKAMYSVHDLSRLCGFDLATSLHREGESEHRVGGADGERWIAIRTSLLVVPEENEGGLQHVWIVRDVTLEKLAERERERAHRANVLAEISTILAHEIRNPLASMELFAGLIEDDRSNCQQWITNLRAGIRSLSGTVNNVLNLNNPNSMVLMPINLASCVEAGVEFVRPIAQQDEVMLTFASASNKTMVRGNENAIQQVVLNIVTNAIRHTRSGGDVRVTVSERTRGAIRTALLRIKDSGCGIPADLIKRIFEPGFSGSGDSPGLGLAVCKRLVERMNGAIHVSSTLESGTTFDLEFPIL